MNWNEASCCEYGGKAMKTETITWWEFPNGGKAIVEQILAWEEINKRAGLWEPVWDASRKVKHLSRVACNQKL